MAKTVIRTDALMAPIAQFSHGLRVGDEIHLGATAGTDATRRLVGREPGLADPWAQADQMYRNMKLALETLGGRMEHVVRLKSYVTDWRHIADCEDAYGQHFRAPHPSRCTVATWGFPLPFALIEAELTADVGRSARYRYEVAAGEDARNALSRLAGRLGEAGLALRDVVKANVTLVDERDYQAFEEIYKQFFRPPYPARSVSVAPLSHRRMRIEIESIAIPGGGQAVEGRRRFRGSQAASAAMRVGPHLFIGAQPGIDANGRALPDAQSQTRAAWQAIHALLEEAGMAASDVVRTNNWLTDWRSYNGFNAGYGEFVEPPYPPRATVLGGLPEPLALVQIEALAHSDGRNATVLEAHTQERNT